MNSATNDIPSSQQWQLARRIFRASVQSSMHCAVASINADGSPHVTPIGSVMLGEPGQALYFERFTRTLPANIQADSRLCILAVNSSLWLWIKALLRGRFDELPAVRLHGTAGKLRYATEEEKARWNALVGITKPTRGYKLMWADMHKVREIAIERVEPVRLGAMTAGLWRSDPGNDPQSSARPAS